MAYYQCFKTLDRTVYCSSMTFKSHAPAALWVQDCLAHFGLQGSDIHGKPYEADSQPRNAVIYP